MSDPLHKYPPPPSRGNVQSAFKVVDEDDSLPTQDEGYWAWATASWLGTVATPLLIFPRLILFMATPPKDLVARDTLTHLEWFLCVHVALLLLALALALIVSIPSNPIIPVQPIPNRPYIPQTHPLLVPLTPALLVSSFIAFNTSSTSIGALGMLLSLGNGFTGLWGAWVIVFGGQGHWSRSTGADKRTSAFLFGNKSSASQIKKAWKKEREKTEGIELKNL
ncbi:hypothetical protein DACRYDRAFT_19766 [Dacryopinax primogenitus]|uniref:Uncharacterized protein n=1 Tax=Dacryopinax primogenitus (strain DJM 731) TaxID=1858805 RepID=M5GGB3_DACPD|nr:uncharacterized protein DACRYDRAFT_19766 [Dacryopinax primogenitus]EJU05188.1 hypothetical protein DACRYDRAFT_19766 [Dacryopinax primogenitus]